MNPVHVDDATDFHSGIQDPGGQSVTEQGDSFAEAARKLDLRESLLRRWKTQLASEG